MATSQSLLSNLKWVIGLLILAFVGIKAFNILTGASDGEKAPDFTAELIDGSSYSLSDSKGHYVVLDFWGSWCGPCLKDNPKLVALSKKYDNATFQDGAELHVVTVALEKKGEAWKRAADRFGFDWKRQIVHHHKVVMASPIANDYGVLDIPAKFLIDPAGNIITAKASFEEIDAYLAERLIQL